MSKYQALIDALNGTSSVNWEHDGGADVFESGTGFFIASAMESEDAAYIAAANPSTIRSLLADLERAEKALLQVARMAEDLKRPCSMEPDSPQAIRNGEYMNISYVARAALSQLKEQQ